MIERGRIALPGALVLLAVCASHCRAELDPAARERVAAIAGVADAGIVREDDLRRGDASGPAVDALRARLAAAANEAMPFLDESVRKADWNDAHMGIDGPVCFDAAPKLGMMLRAGGFPVVTATTGSHGYLIAVYPQATFVVDPTIRQYFGQDLAPDWVPRIFVGTISQLAALYVREPGEAVLPFKTVYFEPQSRRNDSMILGRRDRFLWNPSSAEHAPLAVYFNAQSRRERLRSFTHALPLRAPDWAGAAVLTSDR